MKIILKEIDERVKEARRVQYIINGPEFEQLWEAADKDYRDKLNTSTKESIMNWMLEHPIQNLGELPMFYLRHKAESLGIKGITRKTKSELILAIERSIKNVK